jgi:hypothetical protein
MFELDHLFIATDEGAPAAEELIDFGLTEGTPNVHVGQGTANRRFFFHNAFLELLWVRDPDEAQSDLTWPTQLWERWSRRRKEASPFGLCLRPVDLRTEALPFPSWQYRPAYLPSPLVIHVAENIPPSEPTWFYLPFGRRPDAVAGEKRQRLDHAVGFREVTGVRFTAPRLGTESETARRTASAASLTGTQAREHLLEMTFDGGSQGKARDFRPILPLIFRW